MTRRILATAAVGVLVAVGAMGQSSCSTSRNSADREQSNATAELTAEANRQIGMPGITNFTERRLLRQLYELRDQEVSTFTYVVDMQGRLWHVCDSIGFGIPFSAQFSNPERPIYYNGVTTIPQPEPNGIFPPTSSSATWVICSDPGGAFKPIYVEPSITVSTFELNSVGSYSKP